MKIKLQQLLIAIAGLLVSANANAYDFSKDGIYYNITSETTVEVTYSYYDTDSKEFSNNFTGNLTIPAKLIYNNRTYTVTEIDQYAFWKCKRLTSVTIPNSVKTIDNYAFYYCPLLTSVTIGNSVTDINDHAFGLCVSLTSVTIGNSVRAIGPYAFYHCPELTSVTIPNSVKTIGVYAFCDCTRLTSVTIGNSVTSIREKAFCNCTGLTSVTIPNSVETISRCAFYNCTGLTSVTIGNSVKTIDEYAFRYCKGLTSVTIVGSSNFEFGVFADCDNIRTVYCQSTTPPSNLYFSKYVSTLYVPIGYKSAYKAYIAAGYMSDFGIIKEMEFNSIEDIVADGDEISVIVQDGEIVVNGIENDLVEVYNFNGQLVYSGNDTTIAVADKGIYIVKVTGKTFKVAL